MGLDTWSTTDVWLQWRYPLPCLWSADLCMCLLSKDIGKEGLTVSDKVSDAGSSCCTEHNPYLHPSLDGNVTAIIYPEPIFTTPYLESPLACVQLKSTETICKWYFSAAQFSTEQSYLHTEPDSPLSYAINSLLHLCKRMINYHQVSMVIKGARKWRLRLLAHGDLCLSTWFSFP